MREDPGEQLSEIVFHSSKQRGDYAKECQHGNLHCEGEPYDDEQYDEETKMEQLDVEPPPDPEPLEVFTAN